MKSNVVSGSISVILPKNPNPIVLSYYTKVELINIFDGDITIEYYYGS